VERKGGPRGERKQGSKIVPGEVDDDLGEEGRRFAVEAGKTGGKDEKRKDKKPIMGKIRDVE